MLGGENGGVNRVLIERKGETYIPPHLSKDQNVLIEEGDTVPVSTPGGGGFGEAFQRDPNGWPLMSDGVIIMQCRRVSVSE